MTTYLRRSATCDQCDHDKRTEVTYTSSSDMANPHNVQYRAGFPLNYPRTTSMTFQLPPALSQSNLAGNYIRMQIGNATPFPSPLSPPPDLQRHNPSPSPTTDHIIADINTRLSKLDLLQQISDRLSSIENRFAQVDLAIGEIKKEPKGARRKANRNWLSPNTCGGESQ